MKTIEITQKLRKELENQLKPDRFDHTLGVAYTSASMAIVHGADIQKALIAGMLHDCAKCMTHEEYVKICEKNKIDIYDIPIVTITEQYMVETSLRSIVTLQFWFTAQQVQLQ